MRVAIIGAGICGLYLAWKLSEKGHNVTVFEKKEKIGKEVCSGLFSERILNLIPQSQKLIQNQIKETLIYFPKRKLTVVFSQRFLVMSHSQLDSLVFSLAERAGAKIIFNQSIKFLPEGFDRIIGCDGYNSTVRKNLGLPDPSFRLAIQGSLEKVDNSDCVEAWPTRNGFLWRIPRGRELEYGIIEKPERAKKLFEKFLEEKNLLSRNNYKPIDRSIGLNLKSVHSALIPQGLIIPQNPKITLCGDAAGLTKPWSGGGVIWGLEAAGILLKNFPDFLQYKKEVKRFFLPKIIFSKIVTKMVYFFGYNFPWILPKEYRVESDFLI